MIELVVVGGRDASWYGHSEIFSFEENQWRSGPEMPNGQDNEYMASLPWGSTFLIVEGKQVIRL